MSNGIKNFFESYRAIKRTIDNRYTGAKITQARETFNFTDDEIELVERLLRYYSFAHIFEIAQNSYIDFIIANEATIIDDTVLEYIDNFSMEDLPLPSPWTFISVVDHNIDAPGHFDLDISQVKVLGFMISKDLIATLYQGTIDGKKNQDFFLVDDFSGNAFKSGSKNKTTCLNLMTIVYILKLIDSFQTTVIDMRSPGFKLKCNLYDKKRQIPKPQAYYRVNMQNKTRTLTDQEIDDHLRIIKERTHAYFVEAHTRHRISRGSMPMDEKTEIWLRKDYRRKIFTSQDQIDSESLKILTKRGIFWRDGEWISLLPYRVAAHIANTTGKDGSKNPYVPSIHVVPS